jgi:hypothetical protein
MSAAALAVLVRIKEPVGCRHHGTCVRVSRAALENVMKAVALRV